MADEDFLALRRKQLEPTDWQHLTRLLSYKFEGYREGWRGLWDHAIEVITRKEPKLIPHNRDVTFSCWVKGVPSGIADVVMRTEQDVADKTLF